MAVALVTVLLALIVMLNLKAETVPQTQTVLRSYFQTGLRPTQTNYWEWIDTMFWYANQTYTNALVAEQQLGQLQSVYLGYVNFNLTVGTVISTTYNSQFNVASVVVTNAHTGFVLSSGNNPGGLTGASVGDYSCTITFSNSLPGTNYFATFSSPQCTPVVDSGNLSTFVRLDGLGCPQVTAYTKTTTNFMFMFSSQAQANFNGLNVRVILQ